MSETTRGKERGRKDRTAGSRPAARSKVRDAGPGRSPIQKLTYRAAGVDIDAKIRAIQRLRMIARGTFKKGVMTDIGAFGGIFDLGAAGGFRHPVLVSSTDGVGTKLTIAIRTGNHRTIGMDLVNHCVNDILVQGAAPLFFLDYVAMGRIQPDVLVDLVTGLARACRDAGCALIGGETAEMPGLYRNDDYDIAGFIVGIVEREHVISGSRIAAGDVLIGLASSGLHTNGYSLARKIFFDKRGLKPETRLPELGRTVGEELLAVHRSYLPVLRDLIPTGTIYGMAHITGGGLTDNIPRVLPRGVAAEIALGSWPVPPVFQYLQREGRIDEEEMLRTFNMGIGMVLIVPLHHEAQVLKHLDGRREKHFRIGEIVRGNRRVNYTRPAVADGVPSGSGTGS